MSRRLRRVFDLEADPGCIARSLRGSPLPRLIRQHPGIRVPGGWCGFELGVRAILGQQISVAAATTQARRVVERVGVVLPEELRLDEELNLLFPTAAELLRLDLQKLPMPASRTRTLEGFARAARSGLDLDDLEPAEGRRRLLELTGIGPWTASYIAMRALRDPDAFPEGDLVLRQALGVDLEPVSPKKLEEWAEAARPWRSYAGDAAVARSRRSAGPQGSEDLSATMPVRREPAVPPCQRSKRPCTRFDPTATRN